MASLTNTQVDAFVQLVKRGETLEQLRAGSGLDITEGQYSAFRGIAGVGGVSSTPAPEPIPLSPEEQLSRIKKLQGRMPLQSQPLPSVPGIVNPPKRVGGGPEDIQRDVAYRELIESGVTPEQIRQVLMIQQASQPGLIGQLKQTMGEDIGGNVGGALGGSLMAEALGKVGPLAALPEEFVTRPLFAAGGAWLLGGAGRTVQDVIDPLRSPSIDRFIKSANRQSLFEAGARIVPSAIKRAVIGRPNPTIKEMSDEMLQLFKNEGGFFSPRQQRAGLNLVSPVEELSRGSFAGENLFEGMNKAQVAQSIEASNVLIKRIADGAIPDADKLGAEIRTLFALPGGTRKTLLDEFFDPFYKEVNRLNGYQEFGTKPIKEWITKTLERDKKLGGSLLSSDGRSKFKNMLKNLSSELDIEDLRTVRSKALADARQFSGLKDKSDVMFDDFAGVVDDTLFNPKLQEGMNPEAKRLLRNTNAVYGPSREMYQAKFLKQVLSKLETSPSSVVNAIFKDMDFDRLKKVREALMLPIPVVTGEGKAKKNVAKQLKQLMGELPKIKGGQEAAKLLSNNMAEGKVLWNKLSAAWLTEQMAKSYNPNTGLMNTDRLIKSIRTIPPKTRNLMYPQWKGQRVNDIAKLFEVISPPRRGFVSVFGKGFELGGSAKAASALMAGQGIAVLKGGTVAITPGAYAMLATSKAGMEFLENLGKTAAMRAGTPREKLVVRTAVRALQLLRDQEREEQLVILKEQQSQQAMRRSVTDFPRLGRHF